MSQSPRVVILGGHGKVALLAAPKLVSRGYAVSSVIRNPEHADDVRQAGAEPVILDIEGATREDLVQVFSGAAAVVFSAGAGGGNPARTHAVDYQAATTAMQAATDASVKRFVMVSYSRALVDVDNLDRENSFYPYAKAKHDADQALRDSGLDYTILGPGALTLEPATGKVTVADEQGLVNGQAPVNGSTARANVAEAIAIVIEKNLLIRQTANFYDGETPMEQAWS